MQVATAGGAESIILSADGAERMIVSALSGCVIMLAAAATKTTTIGVTDNHRFMTLVNSASMAQLICLPPKGAESCHTSNILLVGR